MPAFATPLQRVAQTFTSHADELTPIRDFVERLCRETARDDLSSGLWLSRLLLAVNEAASNIMRHAYDDAPDREIVVEAERFADRIVLRLLHQGREFDAGRVPPPSFDGSRTGGFGCYLIEQFTDGVSYTRDLLGTNCVELLKRFPGPGIVDAGPPAGNHD